MHNEVPSSTFSLGGDYPDIVQELPSALTCILKLLTLNQVAVTLLWNNQQMRQCAVKFISLQVHSTCFGRYTRPSSGVQS